MKFKLKSNLPFIEKQKSFKSIPLFSSVHDLNEYIISNYQCDSIYRIPCSDIVDLSKFKKIATESTYSEKSNPNINFNENRILNSILDGKAIVLCHLLDSSLKPNRISYGIVYTSSEFKSEVEKFIIDNFIPVDIKLNRSVELSCIIQENGALTVSNLYLPEAYIDLNINYNDDLIPVDNIISNHFKSDKSGLIILHGDKGTGKTMYIRSLIQRHKNVKFVFLSPEIASNLTSPALMGLMSDLSFMINSNSNHEDEETPEDIKTKLCFIVEEAEPILMKRGSGGNDSGVAALLNMTDGLLGAALNITIITTFNTELKNIDTAALREGRLITRHKFLPLKKEKALNLAQSLGIDKSKLEIKDDIRLSSLYNSDSISLNEEASIGFKK